jgi:hypothetical protein
MDMVVMGSGSIVSQLAQEGLIDEYQLVVYPPVRRGQAEATPEVDKNAPLPQRKRPPAGEAQHCQSIRAESAYVRHPLPDVLAPTIVHARDTIALMIQSPGIERFSLYAQADDT